MTLAEFLSKQGMSQADLAAALGTSAANVSRWLSGERFPSKFWVRKIKERTKGSVTADDLLCHEAAE